MFTDKSQTTHRAQKCTHLKQVDKQVSGVASDVWANRVVRALTMKNFDSPSVVAMHHHRSRVI